MRPEDVPMEWIEAMRAADERSEKRMIVDAESERIAALYPLIAQAERERCAKVAEDIWASYRADADRADGAGDAELSMLALRSTTVARQITSNIRALPDGDPTWLAKELGAVKRDVDGWTGAIKQSYETLNRKGE